MQQKFNSERFRKALGAFATGVTIITTVDASGNDVGVTVSSFNSVSLEPPLVLWSLARTSALFDAFAAAQHFAIHILAGEQDSLAVRFSRKGIDRFANLKVERGAGGVALLADCVARFECRSAAQYEGGDHAIFLGEVLNFESHAHEPLLFKHGHFALAVEKPAAVEPEDAPKGTLPS
jgi:3-hydroxy-9,10-secoandrosta-1,3,5(10)-triene-9,17-dione monooxygenase reductase component